MLQGRLEAMVRLRQATKEWRRGVQGFQWQTRGEMEERKWTEPFDKTISFFKCDCDGHSLASVHAAKGKSGGCGALLHGKAPIQKMLVHRRKKIPGSRL